MQEDAVEAMDDIDRIVLHYGAMLYRICLVMLGNHSYAEDALQNTFLTYLQKVPLFAGTEHEKPGSSKWLPINVGICGGFDARIRRWSLQISNAICRMPRAVAYWRR